MNLRSRPQNFSYKLHQDGWVSRFSFQEIWTVDFFSLLLSHLNFCVTSYTLLQSMVKIKNEREIESLPRVVERVTLMRTRIGERNEECSENEMQ